MGRFEIQNLDEAREIRDAFLKREAALFSKLGEPTKEKKKKFEESKHADAQEEAKDTFSKLNFIEKRRVALLVKKIQQAFRDKVSTDTLFPVNPNGIHSDYVDNLINQQSTIKKNINKEKQDALLSALERQDYQDPIFTDSLMIQTAIALLTNDKITPAVFETLLGRYQASQQRHGLTPYALETHHILNDQGEFTQEAKTYLVNNLDGFMRQDFSTMSIALNNFKFLLQAFFEIYPSENYFYIIKLDHLEKFYDQLATVLSNFCATLYDKIDPLIKIHLSTIGRLITRLSAFGLEDTMPTYVMLGKLDMWHIEKGVRFGFRPQAGTYPEVSANENIHNYEDVSAQTKSDHDTYHADLMSREGKTIREVLLRSADVMRRDLLAHVNSLSGTEYYQLFSKVTWKMIDGEFAFFNQSSVPRYHTDQEMAKSFCEMLDNERYQDYGFFYYDKDGMINDMGIVCMIDMVMYPEVWQDEIGFYPEWMTSNYRASYPDSLKTYFKPNDSLYNILIYRIWQHDNNGFSSAWEKIIDDQYDQIKQDFIFKRNNKLYFLGVVDTKADHLPLKSSMIWTMARLLNVPYEVKDIPTFVSFGKQLSREIVSLFNMSASLMICSQKNAFIKKHVIIPICQSLMKSYVAEVAVDYKTIKHATFQLRRWIDHLEEKNKNALHKIDTADLENVFKLMEEHINKNINSGMKKGFLLNKKN